MKSARATTAAAKAPNSCATTNKGTSFGPAHPDALALDLALPDGDGVQLLRRLSGAHYKRPLFIISSQDESVLETCEHLAQEFGLRITGHVRKPVTATIFSELLGRSGLDLGH